MNEHKEVLGFEKSSWPAEKPQRAMSIVFGILIAAASFTLVLSAVAWFMPKFLLFVDSRWARVLPAISLLFICVSGLVRYRLKRQKVSGNAG
jgi:hypothetical protein